MASNENNLIQRSLSLILPVALIAWSSRNLYINFVLWRNAALDAELENAKTLGWIWFVFVFVFAVIPFAFGVAWLTNSISKLTGKK